MVVFQTIKNLNAKYVKTGFTMQPVLQNVVTVSEENHVKNKTGFASMAAVLTSNPLFVKYVKMDFTTAIVAVNVENV